MLEGFVSFCGLRGLASKSVKTYIDGIKFFATTLNSTPLIPGRAVIKRLLAGLRKLGKRPSPRKLCVRSDDLREMVSELGLMHLEATLSDYEVHCGLRFLVSHGSVLFESRNS